ncbi:MAG: hypothetical protein Q8L68_00370, partial [Methylococcales bacterium]|nr:hypothetical protein [Methylococcales bacterium]
PVEKDLSQPPSIMYTKGLKAVLKFLRKCFTLNGATDDEKLLHGIYCELKVHLKAEEVTKSAQWGGIIYDAVKSFLNEQSQMDVANRFEAQERKGHAHYVGLAIANALGVSYPELTPRGTVDGAPVQPEPSVMILPVEQPAYYGDLFLANRRYTTVPTLIPIPTPAAQQPTPG